MSKMAGTKRAHDNIDTKASKKAKKALSFDAAAGNAPSQSFEDGGDYISVKDTKSAKPQKGSKAENGKENKKQYQKQQQPYNGRKDAGQKQQQQQQQQQPETFLNGNSSREAHAKQKALTQERKAARPHADSLQRSKKLWERLRRKSHVQKEERDTLVAELFDIISGHVKDFVFKHDAVRVIQCALKYATPAQRKAIAAELQGSYRELAESKYAKFLIAKMVMADDETKDAIVREFYGHVKRLIRHPEASWIVDDIYRGVATPAQKATMLREWYGPEFVVFAKTSRGKGGDDGSVTADLGAILAESPEKRGPIMQHLKEMTNQLVQKKTTGFTILHDALLQYFLNVKPGSPEATEFLEMLQDDEEGDCIKNLAFTKSGSRLVCLALAYGNSKNRRTIMKFFKTHIALLASDPFGCNVLLTAYDVIDDTVMSAKAIFPELLCKDLDAETREQELLSRIEHRTARVPLLYLMSPDAPKWLVGEETAALIAEVRTLRKDTSKKDGETRRAELLKQLAPPLLELIAAQAPTLVQSSFGCQFVAETLLGGTGDKTAALQALADLAGSESEEVQNALVLPAAGRMLKSLVQGGRFDKETKAIVKTEPALGFHDLLFRRIQAVGGDEAVLEWVNGANGWVMVAMLEAEDMDSKEELGKLLKANVKGISSDSAGANMVKEKIGVVGGKSGKEGKGAKGGKEVVKEQAEKTEKKEKKDKKEKKAKKEKSS